MKKLSISLVIALAAVTGVTGATAASASFHMSSMPCCKTAH